MGPPGPVMGCPLPLYFCPHLLANELELIVYLLFLQEMTLLSSSLQ
jgi:hypothetical protein